jgi:hypothetical protein
MKNTIYVVLILAMLSLSCALTPTHTPVPVFSEEAVPPASATWTAAPTIPPTRTATARPTATATTVPTRSPETISFYRLRIEFTTSSDWTTLQWLNPENVLAVRQMGTLGSPTNASASMELLALNQPLSAAEAGGLVGMTVDAAVDPQAMAEPLSFLLQKGALNGSTVRIYAVSGEAVDLLLEVDHQIVVASDPGYNPRSFTLDLSGLSDVEPQQVQIGAAGMSHMVWAFYYPWYHQRDWNSDLLTDRPAVRYDSYDPEAIDRHIEQAQAAGIQGFISSWWGPQDYTDQNLFTLLNHAEAHNFRVMIYFETLDNNLGRPQEQLYDWLEYFIQTYGDHPAYMRVDGKPVIVVWASDAVPLDTWRAVFADLGANGYEALFLGMGYRIENLEVFDGYHTYGVFTYPDLVRTNEQARRMARYFPLLMDDPQPKIFAASVQPGYDDHLLPDRGGGQVQERLDGEYYRSTWEAAIAADPDWIFITTWNEWWESTQIEPSETYGDLYLQITREYVDRWMNP